jgi:transposase
LRNSYPSDVSREQFEVIKPLLLSARKITSPRKLDLYDVFCAVFYLLKTACQWRMLPRDFPKWRSVHSYYQIWSERVHDESSLLEKVLKKLVQKIRVSDGREEHTSFIIIDAQSVKNTATAENKGYDAGKKISGIKRHIAVDTQGLPHAIHITTANITDRAGAIKMVSDAKGELGRVKNVLVDGGYSGEQFSSEINEIIGATVEVAKRSELHQFVVIPRRWVVERSFAWLEQCRRLWKNCERKIQTSLQMVVLAFVGLLLKRL